MRGNHFLAACALFIAALAPPAAEAHGAIGFEQSACVLKVGPDFMYFSGYQPVNSQRKFCEDVPEAGNALFVFDYAQDELREMKADFRILRGAVNEEEEQARLAELTVAYLPPAAYPAGTFNFEHDFKEKGDYVGVVTLDGPGGEHWTARFPFSVGGGDQASRTPYYLLTAAFVLGFLVLFWGRGKPESRG